VDVIDRPALHVSRVVSFAQCRRDARRNARWNVPDMTQRRTVNMAAENRDDASGVLQRLPQP
jgi:hypothetical protein